MGSDNSEPTPKKENPSVESEDDKLKKEVFCDGRMVKAWCSVWTNSHEVKSFLKQLVDSNWQKEKQKTQ